MTIKQHFDLYLKIIIYSLITKNHADNQATKTTKQRQPNKKLPSSNNARCSSLVTFLVKSSLPLQRELLAY